MYITSTSGYSTIPCTAQITKNKNRLKIYPAPKGKVFLNEGDEFEIELFNPKKSTVLAMISLNGKKISAKGIVLYPGQRIFLERFIDSSEKFKFFTYKVNNSEEVREAISNNGLVKVEFYEEYSPVTYRNNCVTLCNNDFPINLTNGTSTSTFSTSLSYCYFNLNTAGSLDSSNLSRNENRRENSILTGRIEKGSDSDQNFTETHGDFNSWPSQSIEYQILPKDYKPVEISEIRNYCTSCGTRNKKTWKFCPTCGQKF